MGQERGLCCQTQVPAGRGPWPVSESSRIFLADHGHDPLAHPHKGTQRVRGGLEDRGGVHRPALTEAEYPAAPVSRSSQSWSNTSDTPRENKYKV